MLPIMLGAGAMALFIAGLLLLTSAPDPLPRVTVKRAEAPAAPVAQIQPVAPVIPVSPITRVEPPTAVETPASIRPQAQASSQPSNTHPFTSEIVAVAPATAQAPSVSKAPAATQTPVNSTPRSDPAESAYAELLRFDGVPASDNAGRVARINAFLERYGDSPYASRATMLLSTLRESLPESAADHAKGVAGRDADAQAVAVVAAKSPAVEDDVPAAVRPEPAKPPASKTKPEIAAAKAPADDGPEGKAKAAWDHAENLFANQHYTDARQAYEGLQRTYGKSKTYSDNLPALKDRLIAIDRQLNNTGPGLLAVFFSGTKWDAAKEVLRRIDTTVNFNWESNAPGPGVPQENFSTRWSGWLTFPKTGRYTLYALHDDGFAIWIDGSRLDRAAGDYFHSNYELNVISGRHEIRIDFCQYSGPSCCQLQWQVPGSEKIEAIPGEQFTHDTRQETKPKR